MRIGSRGDVIHRIKQELRICLENGFNRLETGINDPTAGRSRGQLILVHTNRHLCGGLLTRFTESLEGHQTNPLVIRHISGVRNQCLQILIEDLMLFIGEVFESRKGLIELSFRGKLNPQLCHTGSEGITPGMFPEYHAVGAPAHVLCAHDFIGFTMFQNAILMDA